MESKVVQIPYWMRVIGHYLRIFIKLVRFLLTDIGREGPDYDQRAVLVKVKILFPIA